METHNTRLAKDGPVSVGSRKTGRRRSVALQAFVPLSCVMLGVFLATAVNAEEVRRALPGEIFLIQDVPKQPATRPGYKGHALLLDLGQVKQAGITQQKHKGLVEITDSDAAVINGGTASSMMRTQIPINSVDTHISSHSSGRTGSIGVSGGAIVRGTGNITRITDGVGKQIGAVTQHIGSHKGMR